MLLPKFRHFEGQNFKNRMSISKTLSINNGKNLYLRKRMQKKSSLKNKQKLENRKSPEQKYGRYAGFEGGI